MSAPKVTEVRNVENPVQVAVLYDCDDVFCRVAQFTGDRYCPLCNTLGHPADDEWDLLDEALATAAGTPKEADSDA